MKKSIVPPWLRTTRAQPIARFRFFVMGLLAGVALKGVLLALVTDALGMEGTVAVVRSTWMDARWTVPWAIGLLLVLVVATLFVRKLAARCDLDQRIGSYEAAIMEAHGKALAELDHSTTQAVRMLGVDRASDLLEEVRREPSPAPEE